MADADDLQAVVRSAAAGQPARCQHGHCRQERTAGYFLHKHSLLLIFRMRAALPSAAYVIKVTYHICIAKTRGKPSPKSCTIFVHLMNFLLFRPFLCANRALFFRFCNRLPKNAKRGTPFGAPRKPFKQAGLYTKSSRMGVKISRSTPASRQVHPWTTPSSLSMVSPARTVRVSPSMVKRNTPDTT